MTEQINLTTPVPGTADRTNYIVDELHFQWTRQRIDIYLLANNGERQHFDYEGQVATDLMVALNKADLSTKSLHRRVIEKLVADGLLSGAISGMPE